MCLISSPHSASHCAWRFISTFRFGGKLRDARLWTIAPYGLIVAMLGGCATLDAQREVVQSADYVEHATGVQAEIVLHDEESARGKTDELLAGGISHDEAVQVALLNNPRARAAMLSVGVSRADFVQSTLFSNPTLTLSFRFPDGGGLANFEASLSQNIAELWLIPARKQVAQRQLDRTILQAANSLAVIALDARRAYTRARMASQQEAVARDTSVILDRLLEVAERRRQAGSGSEIDVNLARTRKLEAQTNLRNAELATIEAHSSLARILGLTQAPSSLELSAGLPDPEAFAVSPESLQEFARENRLDLRIAEKAVSQARAKSRAERRRFLKSIQVGFALERIERRSRGRRDWIEEVFYDSLQSGQLSPPNFMPRDEQTNDVILGPTFGIELPLWDQNQAQIAKADRLLEQTIQIRDALLVDVAQDIHARLARAKTAAENAIFYRNEQLPAAERNVELSREAYKVGRLNLLNVLEAEQSYLAARSGYLSALEDAAIAIVGLEQVTGRPATALLKQSESQTEDQLQDHSVTEVKP